jgi:hypothetical protein
MSFLKPAAESGPTRPPEKPPEGAVKPKESLKKRTTKDETGADLLPYIGYEKLSEEEKQNFRKQAKEWERKDDAEIIRRAGVDQPDNEKNPLRKHQLLASNYMERDKNAVNQIAFRVNFSLNDLAERKVGAGDLLPANIKAIRVRYKDGRVVERAVRAINPANGRIGYYNEEVLKRGTYQYVPVFSGTTIEILETQTDTDAELKRRQFAENMEIYQKPQRAAGRVGAGVLKGKQTLRDQNVPAFRPVQPAPAFEGAAPAMGKGTEAVEMRSNFEEVGREFWMRLVGRSPAETAKFITSIDPITGGPVTFMGKRIPGGINVLIIPYLKEAEDRIKAAGIKYDVNTLYGTKWRPTYRGTTQSKHSWGVAIDINPRDNGYGIQYQNLDPAKRIPLEFAEIMKSLGFRWGGKWNTPDAMHFDFVYDPRAVTSLLTSQEGKRYAQAILGQQQKERPTEEKQLEVAYTDTRKNAEVNSRLEQYNRIIREASLRYGVPQNLLRAVIWNESRGNPDIVSRAGAGGLMQLMPSIKPADGEKRPIYPRVAHEKRNAKMTYSLDPRDWRADPEQNIMAGAKLLSWNLKRYNGNVPLALAAYNAGPGRVDRAGGIPEISQTKAYVANIMRMQESLNGQEEAAA